MAFYFADKENAQNILLHHLYTPNEIEAHHSTIDDNEPDEFAKLGWIDEGTALAQLPAEG